MPADLPREPGECIESGRFRTLILVSFTLRFWGCLALSGAVASLSLPVSEFLFMGGGGGVLSPFFVPTPQNPGLLSPVQYLGESGVYMAPLTLASKICLCRTVRYRADSGAGASSGCHRIVPALGCL